MALEEKDGWCTICNQRVVVKRKGINHILHLLLSLVTLGAWLIIWILTALLRQPWRCARCGTTKIASGPPQVPFERPVPYESNPLMPTYVPQVREEVPTYQWQPSLQRPQPGNDVPDNQLTPTEWMRRQAAKQQQGLYD